MPQELYMAAKRAETNECLIVATTYVAYHIKVVLPKVAETTRANTLKRLLPSSKENRVFVIRVVPVATASA